MEISQACKFWKSADGYSLIPLFYGLQQDHISRLYELWTKRGLEKIHFIRNCTPLAILKELKFPTKFTFSADYRISSPDPSVTSCSLTLNDKTYFATQYQLLDDNKELCPRCFMFGVDVLFTSNTHYVPQSTFKLKSGDTVIVDEDTKDFLKMFSWYKSPAGLRTHIQFHGLQKSEYMKRLLLHAHTWSTNKAKARYLNQNPLDNRLCNLKLMKTIANLHKRRDYFGVMKRIHKDGRISWRAFCGSVILGSYQTAEEAAYVRDQYVQTQFESGSYFLNNVPKPIKIERIDKRKYQAKRRLGWHIQTTTLKSGLVRYRALTQDGEKQISKVCADEKSAKEWIFSRRPNVVFADTPIPSDANHQSCLSTAKGERITVDQDVAERFKMYAISLDKYGYPTVRIDGIRQFLHRLIMNAGTNEIVDHRNQDKLLNTRANLSIVSHSTNCYNTKKRKGASSAYYGVTINKGKFRVVFSCNCKRMQGGCYKNEQFAAHVADQLAIKYWGKRAKLNNVACPEGFYYDAEKERAYAVPTDE